MPKPTTTGTAAARADQLQAVAGGAGVEPVGAGDAGEAHVVQVTRRVVAQLRDARVGRGRRGQQDQRQAVRR